MSTTRGTTELQASSGGNSSSDVMQADSSTHSDQMMGDDPKQQSNDLQTKGDNLNSQGTEIQKSVNAAPQARKESSDTSTHLKDNQEAQAVSSSEIQNDFGFEGFWSTLEREFKSKRNGKGSEGLPWRENLKEILLTDQGRSGNWIATKQEWKNCQIKREQSGQHVEAYCGYVEFNKGSNHYKMQVSYTWLRNQKQEKWDIKIVKQEGQGVQYYNGESKGWVSVSGNWNTNYGGESNRNMNMWMNQKPPSISVTK